MSINLSVSNPFTALSNAAKKALRSCYQLLPAKAQNFFFKTVHASSTELKSLHEDNFKNLKIEKLRSNLDQFLTKPGELAVFFSDAQRAGTLYRIPNLIQKALNNHPLPDDLMKIFKDHNVNPDEFMKLMLNPTHTGLVVKTDKDYLFIHLDFRPKKPTSENLSPFDGALKIENLREACDKSHEFQTRIEFYKVGHVNNPETFLDDINKLKENVTYFLPRVVSLGLNLINEKKLQPNISEYLKNVQKQIPSVKLPNINLAELDLNKLTHGLINKADTKANISTDSKTQIQQNISGKMVCSDLVAYLLTDGQVNLNQAFKKIEGEIKKEALNPTPGTLFNTFLNARIKDPKINNELSLEYSFA